MTRSTTERLERIFSEVSSPELDSWFGAQALKRYEVSADSSFERLRRGRALTNFVQPLVMLLFATVVLGVVLGTSEDVVFVAGVPLPALLIAGVGIGCWTFIATKRLWHRPMTALSKRPGITVFVVGLFFIGSGYVVDGPHALILTSGRGHVIARLTKSAISGVIAVDQVSNVGLVIKASGRYLEVPVVMQIDGPVARSWSMSGYAPKESLVHAIRDRFANSDIRVVEVDKRYRPLGVRQR